MGGIYPYLIAVTGILSMMGMWLVVQWAWARVFPGVSCDVDVLAGRPKCCGCKKESDCEIKAIVRDGAMKKNRIEYAVSATSYDKTDCIRA